MLLQTSDILQVEPAHIDEGTGLHCHGVGSKVGKEDVAVDVGNDEVEMPRKGLQGRGIAMDDIDAVETVKGNILQGVLHAPFVVVDGHTVTGPALTGQNGKDAGTASHVEHLKVADVIVEQTPDHLRRRLVMSRTEGHLGVDAHVVVGLGHVAVEGGGDDTPGMFGRTDDDGLEIVLFPLLIPIAVLGFCHLVSDGHTRNGEVFYGLPEGVLIVEGCLYVCLEGILRGLVGEDGSLGKVVDGTYTGKVEFAGVDKRFETDLTEHHAEHIAHGFVRRTGGKSEFKIFHGRRMGGLEWGKYAADGHPQGYAGRFGDLTPVWAPECGFSKRQDRGCLHVLRDC